MVLLVLWPLEDQVCRPQDICDRQLPRWIRKDVEAIRKIYKWGSCIPHLIDIDRLGRSAAYAAGEEQHHQVLDPFQ